MNKTITHALLIPVLLLTGCTATLKESEWKDDPQPQEKRVFITARIGGPSTRVSYFEQVTTDENDKTKRLLHQQWNRDDCVYGFYVENGAQKPVVLKVTDIVEEGEDRYAVLECASSDFPSSGTIHMFYLGKGDAEYGPYAMSLDTENSRLSFVSDNSSFFYTEDPESREYINVAGVMTADAAVGSEIIDGVLTLTADLTFENQAAIIGIEGIQVSPGATIDRITLSGVRTAANYQVDEGKLSLNFDGIEADGSVAVSLEDLPEADNEGYIRFETPLLVAVFPRDDENDPAGIRITARSTDVNEFLETQDVYTLSLGPKDIEAGKYYYISTKRLKIPSVKVGNDDGDEYELFASLEEASEYVNSSASWPNISVELLRDCTAEGPVTFTGTQEGQWMEFYVYNNTLTLSGGPIVVDGLEVVSISSGAFVQSSSDQPLLSVLSGYVALDGGSYDGTASSAYLIQVSGTGEVCVANGDYALNQDGLFITSDNEGDSFVQGGRFSLSPVVDGVGALGFYELDRQPYPYICLAETVFESLAHTADGILKTTTVDYDGTWVIMARNNLYNEIEDYRFMGLLWEEHTMNGNPYFGPEIEYSYEVDQTFYRSLSALQWDFILHRSETAPNYMKCCVVDDVWCEKWNHLVLFPDLFECEEYMDDIQTYANVEVGDLLEITGEQAQSLLDAKPRPVPRPPRRRRCGSAATCSTAC